METPQETPRVYKLESIPDANIVDVKMSGYFVKTMQHLLVALGEKLGKDRIVKIIEKIQNKASQIRKVDQWKTSENGTQT